MNATVKQRARANDGPDHGPVEDTLGNLNQLRRVGCIDYVWPIPDSCQNTDTRR